MEGTVQQNGGGTMARKDPVEASVPSPPIPKSLLPVDDQQYEKTTPLKPEDIRARLQLMSIKALDALEWQIANLGDAKSSIAACQDVLDRAGYLAPVKPKSADFAIDGQPPGEILPPIEDEVRGMSEDFQKLGKE